MSEKLLMKAVFIHPNHDGTVNVKFAQIRVSATVTRLVDIFPQYPPEITVLSTPSRISRRQQCWHDKLESNVNHPTLKDGA
jgi:hypothetical protein